MPRRHSRTLGPAPAFHIYNRGLPGVAVFRGDADREHFRNLLSQYLSRPSGADVRLVAFCLMGTHFHLIAVELAPRGLARLMQRLLASYVRYYHRKYGGCGPLFDGPYRRKPITNLKQFRWTIAYVHDNHPTGLDYRYSSHRYYTSCDAPKWLDHRAGLKLFGGLEGYNDYLAKRASRKRLDREFF